MDLSGHALRTADIPACAKLLAETWANEGFDPQHVLAVFPDWISRGYLKGWVVEKAGCLLCFGASVFVSDHFTEALYQKNVSQIGAMLTRQALAEKQDPATTLQTDGALVENVDSGNGFNILILHSGVPPSSCDEQTAARVKAVMMQGFLSLHNGYDVKRIFVEAFDESNRIFYERSHFQAIGPGTREDRSTILVLTREQVLTLEIHPLLPIFIAAVSKCQFSAGEQRLLAHALEGHTDEELATVLNVSLSTVKKRWVSIFQRADDAVPQLSLNARNSEQRRGPQKRHLLLRYLRSHPEELRPTVRTRGANA